MSTAYTSDSQGRAKITLTVTPTATGATWSVAVADGNSSYGGWAQSAGSWLVTIAGQTVLSASGKSYDFGSGVISSPYFPRSLNNQTISLAPGNYTATATFSGDGSTVGTATTSVDFTVTAPTTTTYYYKFDSNQGSNTYVDSTTTSTTLTMPDPGTRSGFTFNGWNVPGISSGSTNLQGTGASVTLANTSISTTSGTYTTILAYWTQNSGGGTPPPTTYYYYSFDSNGGSNSPSSGSTTSGSTTMPSPGTKTGYTFLGWQIGGSGSDYVAGSNAPVSSTSSSNPTNFVAHWTVTSSGETFPPVWSDINLAGFVAGKAYSDAVTATNMSYSGSYSVSSGSLPSGISMNSVNGVISGTVSSATDYAFSITATNSYGSIQQSFSGTIKGGLKISDGTPGGYTKGVAKVYDETWKIGTVYVYTTDNGWVASL